MNEELEQMLTERFNPGAIVFLACHAAWLTVGTIINMVL